MSRTPLAPTSALYDRMLANLIASFEVDATGSPGATVRPVRGGVVAVFPAGPERAFFNNAVLARDLGAVDSVDAIGDVETAYSEAGVDKFAIWAHESECASITRLELDGYRVDTTT